MGISQRLMSSLKGGVLPLDEFFSADLYTGSASSLTVTNGIDLADGGLLWVKRRNDDSTLFFDKARGTGNRLMTPATDAELNIGGVTFNSTGFTLGPTNTANYPANNGQPYVAYSFKEAPKLFDIVTYTGNGTAGREIAHNLGAEPALILVRKRDTAADWQAWSKYATPQSSTYSFSPNTTGGWGDTSLNIWGSAGSYTFNDTVFTVGDNSTTNQASSTYVAYLFADSPDGPIKCGTYSGNASTQTIDCGFTTGAKFLLIKALNTNTNWFVWDAERGIGASAEPYFRLNSATAEVTADDYIYYDPSGFGLNAAYFVNWTGFNFMYVAIGE